MIRNAEYLDGHTQAQEAVQVATKQYDWKRFWVPKGGTLVLGPDKYPVDPTTEWGRYSASHMKTFDEIAEARCLGLLGEPGIGKTSSLKKVFEIVDRHAKCSGNLALWFDLRAYGTEDRLVNNIFHGDALKRWKEGNHQLHLFLDALDEGLLRVDNIVSVLHEELRRCPLDRLTLRITCRTADWPLALESVIKQLWGEQSLSVYELAPLVRSNVHEAALSEGLDATELLRSIDRMEVTSLAMKPVTLQFLLNVYKRDGQLPASQTTLYYEGCRLLCDEANEFRRSSARANRLSSEQLLTVASRIAAVTVFSNKYAVWTGLEQGDVPVEDITVRSLAYGEECIRGHAVQVTEDVVLRCLDTGLFTLRGDNRMSWAHQTYAEFLAAHYVRHTDISTEQVISLLTHPGDPDGRLVPQLHEVAAWCASLNPSIWDELVERDPAVLLTSDVSTVSDRERTQLVDQLLNLYARNAATDKISVRRRFHKLNHPMLGSQLRDWVIDRNKHLLARRVAIDIAEDCGVSELQSELASVALDVTEDYYIRGQAAHALAVVGDVTNKLKIKPLAFGTEDDPDDELKGCALLANWPENLTANELFTCLRPPKRQSFYGAYRGIFLRNHERIVSHLDQADLPQALAWASTQRTGGLKERVFGDLVESVLERAWDFIPSIHVVSALAGCLWALLIDHWDIDEELQELFNRDHEKRQVVVREMVVQSRTHKDVWMISRTHLVSGSDLSWLIQECSQAEGNTRETWLELIKDVFNWNDRRHVEIAHEAYTSNPLFGPVFAWVFEPISISSDRANQLKVEHRRRQEWSRPVRPPRSHSSPLQLVDGLLGQFESGDLDAWWKLNRVLTLEDDSTHYGDELEPDLTTLPGWVRASADVRERILWAAERYVLSKVPAIGDWFGTNKFHLPDFSVYKALTLLLKERPEVFSRLPTEIWRTWAPVILGYPVSSGVGESEPHTSIIRHALQHAPDEMIRALIQVIDQENEAFDTIFIVRRLDPTWNKKLAVALLEKAGDRNLKPSCFGSLISVLLAYGVKEAVEYAEELVRSRTDRARAAQATVALLTQSTSFDWETLWTAFSTDSDYAREVFTEVAAGHEQMHTDRLSEMQLADLFILVRNLFPPAEDPKHDDAHWISPRESAAHFRDGLLQRLKNRGTFEAVQALHHVATKLPELRSLQWIIPEAQEIARRASWVPPSPESVIALCQKKDSRLVANGTQLMEVIIASLARLNDRLQGATPAAIELWSVMPNGLFRPQDEQELSNKLMRHFQVDLQDTGIVVNREVEIRRGYGPTPGERPDLQVQAVAKRPAGERDILSLVIEVKGCWNPKLDQAIEEQLVNRYMAHNGIRYGLYVVGWFSSQNWDPEDTRRDRVPRMSFEEARDHFVRLASRVSGVKGDVASFVLNLGL